MSALKMEKTEKLALGLSELAEALGVSRSFLYLKVEKGEIKSIRLGRRILVPMSEIERLLLVGVSD